jgi:hypothetical protein
VLHTKATPDDLVVHTMECMTSRGTVLVELGTGMMHTRHQSLRLYRVRSVDWWGLSRVVFTLASLPCLLGSCLAAYRSSTDGHRVFCLLRGPVN